MCPRVAPDDVANHRNRDIVSLREVDVTIAASRIQAAHVTNCIGGQLGPTMLLSMRDEVYFQVVQGMEDVLLLSDPFQVRQSVVGLVPVPVVADAAVGAGANERFENSTVDGDVVACAVDTDAQHDIAFMVGLRVIDVSRAIAVVSAVRSSLDTTKVAHGMGVFEARKGFPHFSHVTSRDKRAKRRGYDFVLSHTESPRRYRPLFKCTKLPVCDREHYTISAPMRPVGLGAGG